MSEYPECMAPDGAQPCEAYTRLLNRNEELERFRSAVLGWREYDHPEGFSRFTAEWVANLGEENMMSPPGGALRSGQ